MGRPWDKEGKYIEGFLKKYKFWSLEVSYCQHTLGSCIIFLNRSAERISQLSDSEIVELKYIIKKLEGALTAAREFNPDRFNYMQLGNSKHWLHFHVIPRYKTSRDFAGKVWKDKAFGHMPILDFNKESKADLIKNLTRVLKPYLVSK